MRHLLTILAALLLCSASLHAQTLKSLMYNSTNGQVVANTTNALTFTNALSFGTNDARVQATYQALGFNVGTEKGSPAARELYDVAGGNTAFYMENETVFIDDPFVAPFRASLGFSTNLNTLWTATNAATAARALSGSTNTNHPYSGTVALTNTNAVLTFSNGILQSVQ